MSHCFMLLSQHSNHVGELFKCTSVCKSNCMPSLTEYKIKINISAFSVYYALELRIENATRRGALIFPASPWSPEVSYHPQLPNQFQVELPKWQDPV